MDFINTYKILSLNRGVNGGWAKWAIAHPSFGRMEIAAGMPHYYCPPSLTTIVHFLSLVLIC